MEGNTPTADGPGQNDPQAGDAAPARMRATLTVSVQQHKAITTLAKLRKCEFGELLMNDTIASIEAEYLELKKLFA